MSILPKPPRRSENFWGSAWEFSEAFDFIRGHVSPESYIAPLPGEVVRSNPDTRNIRYFFSLKTSFFNPIVYEYVLHHTQKHSRRKGIYFHPLAGVVPNIALYHTTVSSQFFWRYYMFFYLMTDRAFCFSHFQVIREKQSQYFTQVDKRFTGKLI